MTTCTIINVRELHFEYKSFTRIVGEPEFDSLHQMLLEVKEHLSYVPSTLGGGAHVYAGIVLSAPTYATLAPMTPFMTPLHPGILVTPPGATQYAIVLLKS